MILDHCAIIPDHCAVILDHCAVILDHCAVILDHCAVILDCCTVCFFIQLESGTRKFDWGTQQEFDTLCRKRPGDQLMDA
ncbi:hypothetical protein ACOMHN_031495 [Nucella lapillus]